MKQERKRAKLLLGTKLIPVDILSITPSLDHSIFYVEVINVEENIFEYGIMSTEDNGDILIRTIKDKQHELDFNLLMELNQELLDEYVYNNDLLADDEYDYNEDEYQLLDEYEMPLNAFVDGEEKIILIYGFIPMVNSDDLYVEFVYFETNRYGYAYFKEGDDGNINLKTLKTAEEFKELDEAMVSFNQLDEDLF